MHAGGGGERGAGRLRGAISSISAGVQRGAGGGAHLDASEMARAAQTSQDLAGPSARAAEDEEVNSERVRLQSRVD